MAGFSNFLVVCALKLEFEAFVELLKDPTDIDVANITGKHVWIENSSVTVICLHGMGNVHSGVLTSKIVSEIKPDAVLLVGIAGGTDKPISSKFTIKEHVLGDVIVPEQVFYYENGKVTSTGLVTKFQTHRTSFALVHKAKSITNTAWISRIKIPRPDGTTNRIIPAAHAGTLASGVKSN